MSTVTTTEARTKLFGLIDYVASGGEVIITRRGTPVAKLVPVDCPPWRPVFEPMPLGLRSTFADGEDVAPVFPEIISGNPKSIGH